MLNHGIDTEVSDERFYADDAIETEHHRSEGVLEVAHDVAELGGTLTLGRRRVGSGGGCCGGCCVLFLSPAEDKVSNRRIVEPQLKTRVYVACAAEILKPNPFVALTWRDGVDQFRRPVRFVDAFPTLFAQIVKAEDRIATQTSRILFATRGVEAVCLEEMTLGDFVKIVDAEIEGKRAKWKIKDRTVQ